MDAKIKKQINARAKKIQSFKTDVDTKRACFSNYVLALHEAGLVSWTEFIETIGKPRFHDVEA